MDDITFEPFCAFVDIRQAEYGVRAKWRSRKELRRVFEISPGGKTYKKVIGIDESSVVANMKAKHIAVTLNRWITDPAFGEKELNTLVEVIEYDGAAAANLPDETQKLLAAYLLLE